MLLLETTNQAAFVAILAFFLLIIAFYSQSRQLILWVLIGLTWGSVNVVFWGYYSGAIIGTHKTAMVEGYICSIPTKRFAQLEFDFCLERIADQNINIGQLNKLKVRWGNYIEPPAVELKSGQYWRLMTKLKPPHGRYNPGGKDFQKWMLANGYAGTARVKSGKLIAPTESWFNWYYRYRQQTYDSLSKQLAGFSEKGILMALAMGERGGISQQEWTLYKNTGTSHLLAISGLHIGVIGLWSYWVVFLIWRMSSRLCCVIPAQKVAQLSSLAGALYMLALSGFGLPAQRAFLMLLIFVLSRWNGRYYSLLNILGISLIGILILQPFAVLSISFWLSFVAVFIIGALLNRQVGQEPRWQSWAKFNWFIYLSMMPVSLSVFGIVSFVSLIANLLLVPLTSFLLIPALYAGMLVSLVTDEGAELLYQLAGAIVSLTQTIQAYSVDHSLAYFELELSFLLSLLGALAVFFLLMPKKLFSNGVLLAVILLLALGLIDTRRNNGFSMVVFDIGQGLAIYIETAEGNLLYDTGWGNKTFAMASSTIIPFFRQQGINKLDKLIISHGDSDHSGGKEVVSNEVIVNEVIVGENADNISTKSCHDYPTWRWGEFEFQFLPHLPEERLIGNNASCVLSIDSSLGKILLTGDIEKNAELALVRMGLAEHDIVIAPHHGSETSSTPVFVSQLNPQHVIFSTGYANQWNFPREAVVTRYSRQGSAHWITHQDGAILITEDLLATDYQISAYRLQNKHFWHNQPTNEQDFF